LARLGRVAILCGVNDPSRSHAVQFYGSDDHLCETVGAFVAEGLLLGQPAIIIAMSDHRTAILDNLNARRIDVAEARRLGDLVCMDAEDTLAAFMADDGPDAAAFRAHVGQVIEQTMIGRQQQTLRAYGEMVDVLWRQGKPEQAIKLEILWNELAQTHRFNLLCGYSMGHFYKHAEYADRVRAEHTHVVSDGRVLPFARPA
jgi:hypothetical protein